MLHLNIKEQLKSMDADCFVVFAYGQIIPQDLLNIPSLEAINLHASLLPILRGASPIQSAIRLGFQKTGLDCTMHSC